MNQAEMLQILSRNPLSDTEKDDTEKTIKMIINNVHGVMMRSFFKMSRKD